MKRNEEKSKEKQKVPIMTDFFGGQLPELTHEDEDRLSKQNPKLKGKKDKLLEKYVDEKVGEDVQANFERVKAEAQGLVDFLYQLTKPLADEDKKRRKEEEDDEE